MRGATLLAFGGNMQGRWGTPIDTITEALRIMQPLGVTLIAQSPFFELPSLIGGQPNYINAIAVVKTRDSPAAMLRLLKSIEHAAGRRTTRRWGPRPLDIDIIAMGSQHYNWPLRRFGVLTMPHPDMHRRAFVLAPLVSLMPHWHHPGLGLTAKTLLARLPRKNLRGLRRLDHGYRGATGGAV